MVQINFNGNGCIDYDNTDAGWTSFPICDDCIENNVAMGFPFTYGGTTYTDVDISANGHLHFTGSGGFSFNGDFIADSDVNIAPFWGDVDNRITGEIRYKSFGNKFVVVWEEVAHFGGSVSVTNTFQVVLTADNSAGDKICFCYGQMEWARNSEAGISLGPGSGFLLAGFTQTDSTWNGVGTMGNGVAHVAGHSYCFDPNIVNAQVPANFEITSTDPAIPRPGPGTGGDPHCK